ncbi:MAG: ABC transporter substrate-binding protein [Candidatus Yanofskybacteria bacterium]|nr:ABC transporter substrate-binding protein [Candidatus Yanofskybacteria bacterium]
MGISVVLFFGSLFYLANSLYIRSTESAPARGGTLIEGMVGSPRFLNPLYADASDGDRDLANLIYAGLFTFTTEGDIVPDLAQDWTVEAGGRVYEVTIKEKARWHDGYPVTADDVAFTIEAIKNPKAKSPLQANWIGVEVRKISDYRVSFTLQDPFTPFLERLTVHILPAHLWQEVSPENFPLSVYNLKPIGAGPYRIASVHQDQASGSIKEIELRVNTTYHQDVPYISKLVFRFFDREEDLVSAIQRGSVESFSLDSASPNRSRLLSGRDSYPFFMPRYFALFFNLQQDAVKDKRLREALMLGTDKASVAEAAGPGAEPVFSLLLPSIFDLPAPTHQLDKEKAQESIAALQRSRTSSGTFQSELREGMTSPEVRLLQECLAQDSAVYPEGTVSGFFGPATKRAVIRFQEKYAQDVLAPSGFTRGTGLVAVATRAKLNELCGTQEATDRITIALSYPSRPSFQAVAENLRSQWETLGLGVTLRPYPAEEFERAVIRPREYEVLLFGEILGMLPDPFPFWHSSQRFAPGLNLSLYENRTADTVLLTIRQTTNEETKKEALTRLQDILLQDIPAIPLYDTPYEYTLPKKVKGVQEHRVADPSRRFDGISQWYIETKRGWK